MRSWLIRGVTARCDSSLLSSTLQSVGARHAGAAGAQRPAFTLVLVALAMAVGGWLQSRRVAETMSRDITDLNPGQGLTANLVTAFLVLGASRFGLPVSTTHVSCGSIFGIGAVRGDGRWSTIAKIFTTWVTTLPLAALLGALAYRLLA